VPDTGLVRRPATRPGGALNIAQGITGDLGFFLRASMNDGSEEAYEFTEINRSLAAGLSLKGTAWDRQDDTVGLAIEGAGISRSAQAYLANGGLGILIGDGGLRHYNNEDVLEAYYKLAIFQGVAATADYQLIVNPAYNADRGPVSVLGVRLHGEF
jgi:high affinity Mn2+ porin